MISLFKYIFCISIFGLSSWICEANSTILTVNINDQDAYQIGSELGQQIQSHFPTIQSIYDNYLHSILTTKQFNQLLEPMKLIKTDLDSNYQNEIEGIANSWHLTHPDQLGDGWLSNNEFWLLQFLADLTTINRGSALAITDVNHQVVIGRNLDWKTIPELRSLQTLTVYRYRDPQRSWVNIGFAGLVGVINGFNAQGLWASVLDSSASQIKLAPNWNSVGFKVRNALEKSGKMIQANHLLTTQAYPRSHQIILADRTGSIVLEQFQGQLGLLRNNQSELISAMLWVDSAQLPVTQCFVLKASPANCYATTDYYRWRRFRQLLNNVTNKNQTLTSQNLMNILHDSANVRQAIFNSNTIQSMVFIPKDRSLYLYTQPVELSSHSEILNEKFQLLPSVKYWINAFWDHAIIIAGIIIFISAWIFVFWGRERVKNKIQDQSSTN